MHAYNKTLLIIHKTKQKQLYQDYKKTTTKTIKHKRYKLFITKYFTHTLLLNVPTTFIQSYIYYTYI